MGKKLPKRSRWNDFRFHLFGLPKGVTWNHYLGFIPGKRGEGYTRDPSRRRR